MKNVKMRKLIGMPLVILLAVCLHAGAWAAQQATGETEPEKTVSQGAPKAHFPQLRYEFGNVDEGVKITHDFIIENRGDAPLIIEKVRTD